ncbi:NAD(P)-binding protein [Streptomyces sp. NPDC020983]|uniref:NAD(P)-binding protein n=1 Tax=Streptomyces sp. NPDC020983 TaxID=3365106 RepID=UPI0037A56CA1
MTRPGYAPVIGGGRSGFAAGHHLRRLGIESVILDAEAAAGGTWQHTRDSPRPFLPAR